jgi:hypothetical protein
MIGQEKGRGKGKQGEAGDEAFPYTFLLSGGRLSNKGIFLFYIYRYLHDRQLRIFYESLHEIMNDLQRARRTGPEGAKNLLCKRGFLGYAGLNPAGSRSLAFYPTPPDFYRSSKGALLWISFLPRAERAD